MKISVSRIKVVHCCLISEIASLPFSPAIGMNDNFFNVALRQSERVLERGKVDGKNVVRVNYTGAEIIGLGDFWLETRVIHQNFDSSLVAK